MKKFILATLLLVGATLASCDMEKSPANKLDDKTSIQSMNDCLRLRNYAYNSLRSISCGSYISIPEMQADHFIGVITNGNRMGTIANGAINSGDGDLGSIFAALYSYIANSNYALEKIQEFLDNNAQTLSNTDQATLNQYLGEVHFARAYAYFYLLDHFCDSYTNVGGSAFGVPIVTVYNPHGDTSKYPGRSTQDETYKLIEDDLATALTALQEAEGLGKVVPAANSYYLSSWAVKAMQARVALIKGDYQTAFDKADEVIKNTGTGEGDGIYSLASIANYPTMWSSDASSEIIMRGFMKNDELGSSLGGAWQNINTICDYIPTADALMLLDSSDFYDTRFDSFFNVVSVPVEGTNILCYAFNKFPGNEELRTGSTNNFMNMPKVFRLSEMYLIAAEAGPQCGDNAKAAKAAEYLNKLCANRYEDYQTQSWTDVVAAARKERTKELMGEGFRISDLRRWKQGFKRNGSYDDINPSMTSALVAAGKNVVYQPDDYRYTWPIPSDEIVNNPQLKGQQNPGY